MAKRIVTSGIATGKALPLNAERLSFLQDNVEENINSIINGLLGSYTTGNVIILYGCVFTGTDPGARTMTAGAIYYNGLIYQVDAASFTTTGAQIPLWTIVVTQDTSDPTLMSDGTTQNVSNISKFVLVAGPVGGSGVAGYVCDYNSSVVSHINGDWHYVGATGEPAFGTNNSNSTTVGAVSALRFKRKGNKLLIQGNIFTTTGYPLVFTLPTLYRPLSRVWSPSLLVTNATSIGYANIDVATDGSVSVNLTLNGSWFGADVYVSLELPLD